MRHLFFAAALVLVAAVPAQAQLAEPDRKRFVTAFDAIRGEALKRQESFALLQELCRVAPRRLSGSPAAAAAVEWGQQAMTRLGLTRIKLEPCVVPRWVRGSTERLRLTAPASAAGSLPILALGGSIATPQGGLTAEVIAVTSFEELRRRAAEAKGKIVLFNRPMDPTEPNPMKAYGGAVGQRVRGAVEAAKVGAVAAVVRSMTTELDDVPHTGGMRYAEGVPKIPTCAVSTNGAAKIAALLAKQQTVELHLELSCKTLSPTTSYNVVGDLVGRELPDEIVLVGGHLDSWDVGQGAHDDGAGCVQALGAAALLKRLKLVPRRTIRVVLYMNEENGLAGGRAYAKAHAAELKKHVLAIESDRGGFTPRGFSTDANPKALATLRAIGGLLTPTGADRIVPGYGGADISTLRPAGVPVVGYLPDAQRYFKYHHTKIDTIDKVSPRELVLGTAAIASLAYAVADLPTTLPRNPAKPKQKR